MPGPRGLSPGWGGVYGAIEVDWLPNHILTAGLYLLESSSPSSAVDALGMSFMAAYLLAPASVIPQGLVSFSPMGVIPRGGPSPC